MARLSVGKIPPALLSRSVFPFLGSKKPGVLVKPGIGRDAAMVRHGGKVLVFSTDPITGTSTHIGTHSVIINANDIATSGAKPIWYLCTILLPPGAIESYLGQIMREINQASKKIGVAVLGGHTEITPGLNRPIIAGFMIGETGPSRNFSAQNGRPGDRILFTKTAGLEGTAIIASEYSQKLRRLPSSTLECAKSFSQRISVVKEALAIARLQGVHAMHDPTEGGVITGLWELAEASNLGIEVWSDKIRIAPETIQICSILRLNPLKLMSSGSLLVAVKPSETGQVKRKLRELKVPVSEVGVLTPRAVERNLLSNGRKTKLRPVSRDELYRLS